MSEKLKKFGVIGEPISHSKSPQIFNHLFELQEINAYYTRILSPNENLIHRLNLSGFNITSPYKSSFLASTNFNLVFETSIKSINAVLIKGNDAKCFNFDYEALKKFIMLNLNEINRVLIIGSGDTALTSAYLMKELHLSTDLYGRNHTKALKLSQVTSLNIITLQHIKPEYDLVISTIPNDAANNIINNIKFKFLATSDYFGEINTYKNHFNGITWLIEQAKPFYHKITGKEVRFIDIEESVLKDKPKGIIHLTGFMGAGKSTIGELLADRLNYNYFDVDTEIEKQEKMSVKDIFAVKGVKYFRDVEEKIIIELLERNSLCVISSGGGSITNQNVFNKLQQSAYNIYLSGNLSDLFERSKEYFRPLHFDDFSKFSNLFDEREDLYFSISDLIVNADTEANKLVDTIYEDLHRTI